MASDKYFPASNRKLNKARRDGDVARSSLFSSAIVLSVGFSYVFHLLLNSEKYFVWILSHLLLTEDFRSNNMLEYAELDFQRCSGYLAIFFGLMFIAAVGAECMQVGFYFTLKPLALNFSKLNPIEGFKKNILKHSDNEALMFGLLIEIGKMLAVIISSIVIWLILLQKYAMLFTSEVSLSPSVYFIALYVASVLSMLLLVGAADYLYVRFKRAQRLKMDVTEFKQEVRESEGDPHFKGLRKQLHQEIGMQAAINAVRKAKVLLVGRTRF